MIPILLLFGAVFGYWWRTALVVGTLGWPILLLVTMEEPLDATDLTEGAVFAFINTGVGVAIPQGVRLLLKRRH